MKTIYKYTLDPRRSEYDLPIGAKILTVQGQNEQVCIWAEVDTEADTEKVRFEVYGTGHEIKWDMGTDREYLGTAQLKNGALVFHVYRWTGL